MIVPVVSMRTSGNFPLFSLPIRTRTRVPCPLDKRLQHMFIHERSCTPPIFFPNLLLGDFTVSASNSQPGMIYFFAERSSG